MNDDIDLNLLVALDVLLEEGGVTAAARRLGITQSAMSHRLRSLRAQLNDPLFVAAGRGLVPTERAEQLRPVLADALQRLREAVRTPAPFDPATSERRFVVVGSDFGEFTVLPRVVEELRKRAPHVAIRSRPPAPDIPGLLARGEADVAIGPRLRERAGLVQRLLPADPFVLVVRRDHPRVRRKPTVKQYLAADHLQVVPRGAPGSPLDELLARDRRKRRIALTVGHFTAAPFVVARTDLMWTAQRTIAEEAQRYVDLAIYDHPLALPPFRGAISWHERAHHDEGHRWLREILALVL